MLSMYDTFSTNKGPLKPIKFQHKLRQGNWPTTAGSTARSMAVRQRTCLFGAAANGGGQLVGNCQRNAKFRKPEHNGVSAMAAGRLGG